MTETLCVAERFPGIVILTSPVDRLSRDVHFIRGASGSRLFQNFSTVLIPNTAASFSNFPGWGPVGLVAPPPGWTKY
jgi:hypothetical protein